MCRRRVWKVLWKIEKLPPDDTHIHILGMIESESREINGKQTIVSYQEQV